MYLSFTLLIYNTTVSCDGAVWTEYTEESIMLCWESQRDAPLAVKEPGVILS